MDTHPHRTKSVGSPPGHMPADVRLQFIDWAKQHGHNPVTGAAAFVALQSEVDLDLATRPLQLAPDADARTALRDHLAALGRQVDVAVQFPPVYAYSSATGVDYRYSLMLVIAEDCVEWTGRVWQGLDYQGMLTGRGQGPRANYTQLARMALENELDQERPRYVQA
ncbi:hypothetical protein XcuCFBP2542_06830 [Xanthomonas cucurbitae]|uniref:Uncharacterized protein n=2 Tax=Xanthomonas cucurbitae TaxID=56453 RepID=A0A2S7DTT4_9XANT|nr:hypothetical protein XcuCFBP2542_06830 [Xanthomonas cucurbitae]QHG88467.1 hypothetical protein EBN15_17455 [Xanthomonas cucurbitae]